MKIGRLIRISMVYTSGVIHAVGLMRKSAWKWRLSAPSDRVERIFIGGTEAPSTAIASVASPCRARVHTHGVIIDQDREGYAYHYLDTCSGCRDYCATTSRGRTQDWYKRDVRGGGAARELRLSPLLLRLDSHGGANGPHTWRGRRYEPCCGSGERLVSCSAQR